MSDPRLQRLGSIYRGGASESDERWVAVEAALGLRLPGNYKKMVDLFGASSWGEFLHVLSPFEERLNLRELGEQQLDADRGNRAEFPSHYPLPLYPEAGGLLPWAITDNGDTLYFITRGPPDDWPTLIRGARPPEFEVHFSPPSMLVYRIVVATLKSTVLPTEGE